MKSMNCYRPSIEVFESRQLMAADLAVADATLAQPVDQNANLSVQVATEDTADESSISNGFRPDAVRADIPDLTTGGLIIIEDSRQPDADSVAEQLQVAVDRVFEEADANSDSQLSDEEKEKWEALIHEVMRDFDQRFETRWQYLRGEGGLATDSLGPHHDWPDPF